MIILSKKIDYFLSLGSSSSSSMSEANASVSGTITHTKLVLVLVLKLTFFLPWKILGLVFLSPPIWPSPFLCFSSLPNLIVLCKGSCRHCSAVFAKHTKMLKKNFQSFSSCTVHNHTITVVSLWNFMVTFWVWVTDDEAVWKLISSLSC